MPVQIPADLTIVTLRSNGNLHPQRFTAQFTQQILSQASAMLETRANIKFIRGECLSVTEEMPPGMRADVVDTNGFHFLAARYPAKTGARVLFVDKLAQAEIGGRAREEKRFTLVPYSGDLSSTARKLAHELGHLLGLGHMDEGFVRQPGNESEAAALTRNLMYSGALNPDALLTPQQVSTMYNSQLAKQFGGGGAAFDIAKSFIPGILRDIKRI